MPFFLLVTVLHSFIITVMEIQISAKVRVFRQSGIRENKGTIYLFSKQWHAVWCLFLGRLALPWKSLHLCKDEQKAQYVHELFLIQNSKSLHIFRFEIAFLGIGSMNLSMFCWTNSFFSSTWTSTRDICCNWSSSRLVEKYPCALWQDGIPCRSRTRQMTPGIRNGLSKKYVE